MASYHIEIDHSPCMFAAPSNHAYCLQRLQFFFPKFFLRPPLNLLGLFGCKTLIICAPCTVR